MLEDKQRKAALRSAILKLAAEIDFVGAREFGRLNEAEAREWKMYVGFLRHLDAAENKDGHKDP